ncbi:MAG: D-glycerate dehydrogenase [Tateyamaria sp.]|uniref:2-hydroxyacid dehydrogenase n=1 Tax=Tateyamaria sp. TaxID=1929288 RepID=UPI0032865F1D
MIKPSVLLTRRWPKVVEQKLAEDYNVVLNRNDRPLSEADFREAIAKFDAVLPTVTDKIGAEAMNVPKAQTKILANYGVGFSHIDVNAAAKHGIAITNTPDVLSDCTADLAMTLMLMVARRAGDGEREVRAGAWSGWRPTHLIGTKVSGKTLGIVGFGRIGQQMARRAHHGFGMEIVVFNRSKVDPKILAQFNARQVDTIEDLLPQSDFVSLHCPGGAENRHMINSARLDLMKLDAFLINTARGEVVNEHALAQSLMFDTIGGAALDVFDAEPRINPMLAQCDNLVMLPHLGSATKEAREAMGFRVVDNLNDFFKGSAPRDRVA